MQELIDQLLRLYLPAGASAPDGLARHLAGSATQSFLLTKNGLVRAIVMPFEPHDGDAGGKQWQRLCAVANALQADLGLPAPAVSVSGATGYRLWMSLEKPVPVAMAQQFRDLIYAAYCPDVPVPPGGVGDPVELPPCLHQATGKWAAFIHPGMGASFAEEPGLEMAPPASAQAAFLEGGQSMSSGQFQNALDSMQRARGGPVHDIAADTPAVPQGLLLKDATLEDIVHFLHSKNIEPTFKHLLPNR